MIRFLLPLLLFVVLIGFMWRGLYSDPSELPSQYIGKPAPEFRLPTLKDPARMLSADDLVGQISLVNVWGTWCVGCRAEHDFLMQLKRSGEIPIFAINWRDNRQDALRWLQQLGDPYVASGFDEDGRVGIDWGVYGAPETFLIDPGGNVIYRHPGALTASIWQQEFVPRIEGIAE
tara:strand:- start:3711 stop:4235 length:525 start_codon:yes stop_codon:yes gene_type:complete